MINFENLVESCITLNEASSSDPDTFANYYVDEKVFGPLRTFLQKKFNIQSPWKSPDQFFPILIDTFSRISADALVAFAQDGIFPLMDYVWFTVSKTGATGDAVRRFLTTTTAASGSGTSSTITKAKAETIANDFILACKKLNNEDAPANPLFGYVPCSSTGTSYIRVLQKKIAQNTIGTLSLKNFDNLSIRKAFYGLLEVRRKLRTSVIKKENIPNSIKWIDGILENPQAYAGQIQIPQEIAKLYDKPSAVKLVEISNTMHEFFSAETGLAQVANSAVDSSGEPLATKNSFMNFISNEPLIRNNYIFDFETVQGISPSLSGVEGGYTIKNIRNIDTPTAKELIVELTEFANYVSEAEPRDIAGGLQGLAKMAKGLSLGVPNMGER